MKLNILNTNMKSDAPVTLTTKEFWELYLSIKPNGFTKKEREIIADHWSGNPKPLKGNYKAYVEKIKEKEAITLSPQPIPAELTLQINININDELSN